MSAPDRRAMVERPGKDLSVRRQCALVGVAHSGCYLPKPLTEADDLAVMRHIHELHLELPYYSSPRIPSTQQKPSTTACPTDGRRCSAPWVVGFKV